MGEEGSWSLTYRMQSGGTSGCYITSQHSTVSHTEASRMLLFLSKAYCATLQHIPTSLLNFLLLLFLLNPLPRNSFSFSNSVLNSPQHSNPLFRPAHLVTHSLHPQSPTAPTHNPLPPKRNHYLNPPSPHHVSSPLTAIIPPCILPVNNHTGSREAAWEGEELLIEGQGIRERNSV